MDDTATELRAFVVMTSPPRIAGEEPTLRRWAVLAQTAEEAEEIVRMRVSAECEVKASGDVLDHDEAAALGLRRDQAIAL